MQLLRFVRASALLGALSSLCACSALTAPDEITISAEPIAQAPKPPPAPAPPPQPQAQAAAGAGAPSGG